MLRKTLVAFTSVTVLLVAQPVLAATLSPVTWGPYNAEFPAAGDGLTKDVRQADLYPSGDTSGHAFTMTAWVKPSETGSGRVAIAGVGDKADGWFLLSVDGKLAFSAAGTELDSKADLKPGQWTLATVTSDGATLKLYANGRVVAQSAAKSVAAPSRKIVLAPRALDATPFAGRIAGFQVSNAVSTAEDIKSVAANTPHDDLIAFETGSPTWAIQVRQMYGQETPQDAWTLPHGKAPVTAPVAKPAYAGPQLVAGDGGTQVIKAWSLQFASKVSAGPETISQPGFSTSGWYAATTPGTVLTTLVDRGVYPDPDYGLNNLAIPESLHDQDYWYRTQFTVPADYRPGRHLFVTFKGINYAAEIWVNGHDTGRIKGAFVRGEFDISPYVQPSGIAAIAVKVSPVLHPGIAEEESLAAGPGQNGGAQAQDGPTFVASEGWDWIPSVRDRNTGLWQDVVLKTTGSLRLGDAHIVTALPKADNSEADISVEVPVTNLGAAPVKAHIEVSIVDRDHTITPVVVARDITVAPGSSKVTFSPADFPALAMQHPKLWWPNGYGAPTLHVTHIAVNQDGAVSDTSDTRFGIRQVTYELSLFDPSGHLQRVEANFTKGRELGVRITDGSHAGIRKIADLYGTANGSWATSLTPQAAGTTAVTPLDDLSMTPYLVIKVNGVKIAARGGSWGMDDWRKRVSRETLEPYFRLHRDAHINIIRNWVGQNTEDAFYDLADEYGLMILNDFWASTQNYQLEPGDVPLFLANARDVIDRYRNHPSIVVWFGRNEGVPQPVLNEGLENLVYSEDGTRWYTGCSNQINLQNSGPYSYKAPGDYFTTFDRGFSVEVGTASFPTLEAFKAAVPVADQWPISDAWAYHDWHADGNGSTKPFEAALAAQFGAPTSLPDFERKAQMMNLDNHRAIFEGMNAGLWTHNSGRLLWMTQPAWPSTMWQILSHDYDTQASFYGVMSAAEPVHIQMNLPDRQVIVVNNPTAAISNATAQVDIYDVSGKRVGGGTRKVDVAGVAITPPMNFDISDAVAKYKAVIVRLSLTATDGTELSRNVYWQGNTPEDLKALSAMPAGKVEVSSQKTPTGIAVTLHNPNATPVLETKLTVLDAQGNRILPAYYSDNYVSLLPGESRKVNIDFAAGPGTQLAIRGWNAVEATVPLP